jgi:hypothetical protein
MAKSKYNKKGLGSKNLTNILKDPEYDDFNILDQELEYIDTLFDRVCDNDFELYIHDENKPHKSDYGIFNYYEYLEDLKNWRIQKNKLKLLSDQAENKYFDYENNFNINKETALKISNNLNRTITDEEYAKFQENQLRYKIEYNFCLVIDEIKSYVKDMLTARTSFYSHQDLIMSPKFNIIDNKIYKNTCDLYLFEKNS